MKSKVNTLVCFALNNEAAPFRKLARLQSRVAILIVGIGRENAEKSIRQFLGSNGPLPDHIFTCGFAGGLNPDLQIGDVVYALPEASTDSLQFSSRLAAAGAKPAKFFCADRIATTAVEKKQLREQTGADVVEMESAAIHAVCAERGIACVTLRVISDTANEDLPLDFNALAKPDKNLDFTKLAWAIAKSPGKIGALMTLQKKTSFAAKQMAAVLAQVIQ